MAKKVTKSDPPPASGGLRSNKTRMEPGKKKSKTGINSIVTAHVGAKEITTNKMPPTPTPAQTPITPPHVVGGQVGDVGNPSVTNNIQALKEGDDSSAIAAVVKPPKEAIDKANSEGEAKTTTVETPPPSSPGEKSHVGDDGDPAAETNTQ